MHGRAWWPDLVCGHFHTALVPWQGHHEDRVAGELGREGHALPVLARIRGVQQDGGLATDPALPPIEGYGVEAVVEPCMMATRSTGMQVRWMRILRCSWPLLKLRQHHLRYATS